MKLLETIRFENGEFANLELHQSRMNASRKKLFQLEDGVNLEKKLSSTLFHASTLEGLYKCRIIYSEIIAEIEFVHYQLPKIRSLKTVIDDDIEYSHKYNDRSYLEKLFAQKGDCDDILIVKNGFVTDTFFANILFFNGKEWITPAKPLLKGIQRQFLLETEQISTAEIRLTDLKYFKKARLVNAMIRFEDEVDIEMQAIRK